MNVFLNVLITLYAFMHTVCEFVSLFTINLLASVNLLPPPYQVFVVPKPKTHVRIRHGTDS